MKHFAQIQKEFLKYAAKWDDLSYEGQREYLHKHPASTKRITKRPEEGGQAYDEMRKSMFKKFISKNHPNYESMFGDDQNKVKSEFNEKFEKMLSGGTPKDVKKELKKQLPLVKNLSYEGQQEYKQKFPDTTKALEAEQGQTGLSFEDLKNEMFKHWIVEKQFINSQTNQRSSFDQLPDDQKQKIADQFVQRLDSIIPDTKKIPKEDRRLTERKVKRLGESIAADIENLDDDKKYDLAKSTLETNPKLKEYFAAKGVTEDHMPDVFIDYISVSKKPKKESAKQFFKQVYEDAKKDYDEDTGFAASEPTSPDWKDVLDEDKDALIAESIMDRYNYDQQFWEKNKTRFDKIIKKIRKLYDVESDTDSENEEPKQKTIEIDENKAKKLLDLFHNFTTESGEMIHSLDSVKTSPEPLFLEDSNIEIKYDDGKYSIIGSRKDIKELKSKIKELKSQQHEQKEDEESKKRIKDIPDDFADDIDYNNFKAKKVSRDSLRFLWTLDMSKDEVNRRQIKDWTLGKNAKIEKPIFDAIKKHKLYHQDLETEIKRTADKDASGADIYYLSLAIKVKLLEEKEEIDMIGEKLNELLHTEEHKLTHELSKSAQYKIVRKLVEKEFGKETADKYSDRQLRRSWQELEKDEE